MLSTGRVLSWINNSFRVKYTIISLLDDFPCIPETLLDSFKFCPVSTWQRALSWHPLYLKSLGYSCLMFRWFTMRKLWVWVELGACCLSTIVQLSCALWSGNSIGPCIYHKKSRTNCSPIITYKPLSVEHETAILLKICAISISLSIATADNIGRCISSDSWFACVKSYLNHRIEKTY